MSPHSSERGFALTEILIASVITLVVMGVAFSTFRDGLSLNDSAMKLTDASQNLRAGTNLLVRDLLQVKDITQIQARGMTPSQLEEMRQFLAKMGVTDATITHPTTTLEDLFVRVVRENTGSGHEQVRSVG